MESFIDPTKISDVRNGLECEILLEDGAKSIGIVDYIRSKNDDANGLYVILENGDSGNIIQILNSIHATKKRILSESHTSENKKNYYEAIMQDEQIPHTVQAFLNSEGGYLYIGVYDDAKTESEKFVGLSDEKKILEEKLIEEKKLEHGKELTWRKFEDLYVTEIEKKLSNILACEKYLGDLVNYEMKLINEVHILEINVKSCNKPVFYKHLNKNNKNKQFDIYFNNEKITSREFDDFYYRDGSSKLPINTFEEFYKYMKSKFI